MGGNLRFFYNEKLFTVDCSLNSQNNRWICNESSNIPTVFRSRNPVMVLGISFEGHVMPPHLFPEGLKINKEVYLNVLEPVAVP